MLSFYIRKVGKFVSKEDLVDFTKESAEILIDHLSDNELVKEIPVVNQVVSFVKVVRSVPDYLFAKRLKKFLDAVDEASPECKKKIKSYAQKDGNAEKLFEHILNSINKASDERKCEFIAYMFIAFIDGFIKRVDFQRSIEVIDSVFIDDLMYFITDGKKLFTNRETIENMPSILNSPLLVFNDYSRSSDVLRVGAVDTSSDSYEKQMSSLGEAILNAYNHGQSQKSK